MSWPRPHSDLGDSLTWAPASAPTTASPALVSIDLRSPAAVYNFARSFLRNQVPSTLITWLMALGLHGAARCKRPHNATQTSPRISSWNDEHGAFTFQAPTLFVHSTRLHSIRLPLTIRSCEHESVRLLTRKHAGTAVQFGVHCKPTEQFSKFARDLELKGHTPRRLRVCKSLAAAPDSRGEVRRDGPNRRLLLPEVQD